MQAFPSLALSVRQPWAWAIIHGGKDCENRGPMMIRHLPKPMARRIAIHAAKRMTRDDYERARDLMARIDVACPPAIELKRGGIIGTVDVTKVTKPSQPPQSRWYVGPRALMLANPEPCEFIPSIGDRGYFPWSPGDASIVPPTPRWMSPSKALKDEHSFPAEAAQLDLIDLVQRCAQM